MLTDVSPVNINDCKYTHYFLSRKKKNINCHQKQRRRLTFQTATAYQGRLRWEGERMKKKIELSISHLHF